MVNGNETHHDAAVNPCDCTLQIGGHVLSVLSRFSVFKLGTCFVMVHCFASKDAFLEHQPVLNQLLLDMEIDDTLLQKFKQPFHGACLLEV